MEREADILFCSFIGCIGAILFFLNIFIPIESAYAQSSNKSFFEALSFETLPGTRIGDSYELFGFGDLVSGFSCKYESREIPLGESFFCKLSCEEDLVGDEFLASLDFKLDLFRSPFGSVSCGGSCLFDVGNGYTESSARLTYLWQLGDAMNLGDSFAGRLLSKCGIQAEWSIDDTGYGRNEVSVILGGITF